jgi:Ribbon-helix-helix domain
MAGMARRTTVVLTSEDALALQRASRAEGVSQSELIRKGIRNITAPYRRRGRPLVGWLKLSKSEREEIANDRIGDYDR